MKARSLDFWLDSLRMRWDGYLARLSQNPADHPLPKETASELNRQVESLLAAVTLAMKQNSASNFREYDPTQTVEWVKPRSIWRWPPSTANGPPVWLSNRRSMASACK